MGPLPREGVADRVIPIADGTVGPACAPYLSLIFLIAKRT